MSKQVFTTGQVLTAAQMTQLQTNDYNQTVNTKVASYTLVASDAGTRITMSNASATTITVNTSLFAAGDTLFITNIGAGACTITAGTATVSTISSLVLAQFDSGSLYFTSTGVAIWQKYDGAAVVSGGMTLISTTAITATASVDLTSIPQTFKELVIVVDGAYENSGGGQALTFNNGTTLYSSVYMQGANANTVIVTTSTGSIQIASALRFVAGSGSGSVVVRIPNYTSSTMAKNCSSNGYGGAGATFGAGGVGAIAAITSVKITWGGTPTAQGDVLLYGVN